MSPDFHDIGKSTLKKPPYYLSSFYCCNAPFYTKPDIKMDVIQRIAEEIAVTLSRETDKLVTDILQELEKPGRDPRPEFKSAAFKDGIEALSDLKPGMTLQGVVTNVANFGAFVNIGVHQDGLVHISQLADAFVKDPRDEVKTGDTVKVRILEVETARKRIGLSMKKHADN